MKMNGMRFTGFMETSDGELMLTTIGPVELDDLIERIRQKIGELPPGVNIRVDLISWHE